MEEKKRLMEMVGTTNSSQIIIVANGENEGTEIKKLVRSCQMPKVSNRNLLIHHISTKGYGHNWRLTENGVKQARAAGDFIKSLGLNIDLILYTSTTQSKETLYNLDLPDSIRRQHINEDRLNEDISTAIKDAVCPEGAKDVSFHSSNDLGQPIAVIVERLKILAQSYCEDYMTATSLGGKAMVVVCSRKSLQAFRVLVENLEPEDAERMVKDAGLLNRIKIAAAEHQEDPGDKGKARNLEKALLAAADADPFNAANNGQVIRYVTFPTKMMKTKIAQSYLPESPRDGLTPEDPTNWKVIEEKIHSNAALKESFSKIPKYNF